MFKLRIVNRNESNVNIQLMTSDDCPKQRDVGGGSGGRDCNDEDNDGGVDVVKKKVYK